MMIRMNDQLSGPGSGFLTNACGDKGYYKNIYDNSNAKMTKRQTCAITFGAV